MFKHHAPLHTSSYGPALHHLTKKDVQRSQKHAVGQYEYTGLCRKWETSVIVMLIFLATLSCPPPSIEGCGWTGAVGYAGADPRVGNYDELTI